MQVVDRFILEQIADKGLKSTQTSYLAELGKLEAFLGLDPNLDFDKRLEKLATYVDIMKKQKELNAMKRQLNGAE